MSLRGRWGSSAALLAYLALACPDRRPEGVEPPAPSPPPPVAGSRPVPPRELCVTSGALVPASGSAWLSTQPSLRAMAPASFGRHAALKFRYLGPTSLHKRLRSGRMREQIGLKLLSQNTCNLLYVMWRLRPEPSVVASIKRNPKQSRHRECGNRGYENLRPFWRAPATLPEVGSVHELSASIRGDELAVHIDGNAVLRARVEEHLLPRGGSSGLRGDNVRFELLGFQADLPRNVAPVRPCAG